MVSVPIDTYFNCIYRIITIILNNNIGFVPMGTGLFYLSIYKKIKKVGGINGIISNFILLVTMHIVNNNRLSII